MCACVFGFDVDVVACVDVYVRLCCWCLRVCLVLMSALLFVLLFRFDCVVDVCVCVWF